MAIEKERIQKLNTCPQQKGNYVLYWMQQSQRVIDNHGLLYAIHKANTLRQPLLVFFGLTDTYPEANERHYLFMLEGLKEVQDTLHKLGIKMVIQNISPDQGILDLAEDASLVVVDCGYLRLQRQWRNQVATQCFCPMIQVESDVVIPVHIASPKEEYSAATFRPKIRKHLSTFFKKETEIKPILNSLDIDIPSIDIGNPSTLVKQLKIDHTVTPSTIYHGGSNQALYHLKNFLQRKLDTFPSKRNDPSSNNLSHMSPYLHFGQISPLTIALSVIKTGSPGVDAYLEELIVRRELSMNYVFYNHRYESYQGLPSWAQQTLHQHRNDRRDYTYSLEELERATTHDRYWNAAQKEMMKTGKMHGYMRMYWGKKILEWTSTPEQAYETTVYLNNKYELDGRDANAFTGIAWCFGKHDRPWAERSIFGKVRYMNAAGLERKFPIKRYVDLMEEL
jgi:deoxyribodipyrimidine photo-lyase